MLLVRGGRKAVGPPGTISGENVVSILGGRRAGNWREHRSGPDEEEVLRHFGRPSLGSHPGKEVSSHHHPFLALRLSSILLAPLLDCFLDPERRLHEPKQQAIRLSERDATHGHTTRHTPKSKARRAATRRKLWESVESPFAGGRHGGPRPLHYHIEGCQIRLERPTAGVGAAGIWVTRCTP